MLRNTLIAAAVALTGFAMTAPAASAHQYVYSGYGVYVGVNGHHHVRRQHVDYVYVRPHHNYYYADNGDGYQYPGYNAYITHRRHGVYAYGYPGVNVFVGSGGGLSVSVGF